jgi:hypothetical protein
VAACLAQQAVKAKRAVSFALVDEEASWALLADDPGLPARTSMEMSRLNACWQEGMEQKEQKGHQPGLVKMLR